MANIDLRNLDLRKIPRTKPLRESQKRKIHAALRNEGISVSFRNKGRTILISGQPHNTREWVSLSKKYVKNRDRIERLREKYYIDDSYEQPFLHEYKHLTTNVKAHVKGLKSEVKKQKTYLNRSKVTTDEEGNITYEPSFNRIEEAGITKLEYRRMKFQSFENADEMMKDILDKKGLFHITPSGRIIRKNNNYFKDASGNFRSRNKELEYYALFAENVTERYEKYEEEFYGWAYNELSTVDENAYVEGKERFTGLSKQEQRDLYQEFVKEKLNTEKHNRKHNIRTIHKIEATTEEIDNILEYVKGEF